MRIYNNIKYNLYKPDFKGRSERSEFINNTEVDLFDTMIQGQKDCWKLYSSSFLENFIKSDDEISEVMRETVDICRKYKFPLTMDFLQKFKTHKPEVAKFYELVKSKYDIDLEKPPLVYRFIGKNEYEALKKGEIITPQRGYWDRIDVTINPYLNWNEYRVTFKQDKKFSVLNPESRIKQNPGTGHEYFYVYEGPYSIEDTEKIEECKKIDFKE